MHRDNESSPFSNSFLLCPPGHLQLSLDSNALDMARAIPEHTWELRKSRESLSIRRTGAWETRELQHRTVLRNVAYFSRHDNKKARNGSIRELAKRR